MLYSMVRLGDVVNVRRDAYISDIEWELGVRYVRTDFTKLSECITTAQKYNWKVISDDGWKLMIVRESQSSQTDLYVSTDNPLDKWDSPRVVY